MSVVEEHEGVEALNGGVGQFRWLGSQGHSWRGEGCRGGGGVKRRWWWMSEEEVVEDE